MMDAAIMFVVASTHTLMEARAVDTVTEPSLALRY